ncbi:efflux RND transporter periplasmic adaptor subunit [Falsigemmobacter faecalis]|uniref:Efflux RND transporter periplasmic adaptor subunit n=1 Tax=Falsigemmobacter faecalis TaxID=2488730 RepID=A0A3P3DRN7_9RHOB|nr:efflux RND transporter periplasmic adaptor subunit [Falsigemmobacter faecalis]RRH76923.1 efflux RND transporter periplasmic adaptor subunit [Falsigemmobacter faecalis]
MTAPSRHPTIRSSLPFSAALCAAVMAFAPPVPAAPAMPAPETTVNRPAISVVAVRPAALRDRIFTGGLIQAQETVLVTPLIEGQSVEALLAEVGQIVKAGEVLARLSPTTLELNRSQLVASVAAANATVAQAAAQVTDAEAALAEAERAATRVLSLQERGNASEAAADQARTASVSAVARLTVVRQSLEAAKAQADSTAAQLANVELNLSRTEVRAPVAGEIVARNAQVGGVASAAGAPMFTLMRDGALELRAELSATDLLRIAPGQAADLRLPGQHETLRATVRLVEPALDLSSRLGYARLALDAPGTARAGMYGEAVVLIAAREGLTLPLTAVTTGTRGAFVMVVDTEGRVSRRPVTTGIRDGDLVEVLSGLTEGETVVARAGSFVREGDQITPVAETTK